MAGPRGILAGVLTLSLLEVVTRTTGSAKRTGQLVQLPAGLLERLLDPNRPLLGAATSSTTSSSTTAGGGLVGSRLAQLNPSQFSTPVTKPAPTANPAPQIAHP